MGQINLKLKRGILPIIVICILALYIYFKKWSVKSASHESISARMLMPDKISPISPYEVYYKNFEEQEFSQNIIRYGLEIIKKSNVVLFGMLNEAYVPFTYSWLCNTKPMGIHASVLLLTMDKNSTDLLRRDWPEVHTVQLNIGDFRGDQEYSRAGYVKMMNLRTQAINVLLRNKIPLLLFETDCLWIRNPVPEVVQAVKGYDILVVKPTHKHGYLGGFMCLMAEEATLRVWGKLSEKMFKLHNTLTNLKDKDTVADETNDQVFFSTIMEQEKKKIKLCEFSNKKIVDGKWYIDFTEKDRREMKPLVINNNWVRGNQKKISRAKKWGHWFVSDSLKCNMTQVNKKIIL